MYVTEYIYITHHSYHLTFRYFIYLSYLYIYFFLILYIFFINIIYIFWAILSLSSQSFQDDVIDCATYLAVSALAQDYGE